MSDCKEERTWEFAVGMNTISAYQGYLHQYPGGRFCREARRRIFRKVIRIALLVISYIVMISLAVIVALRAVRSVENLIG